MPRRHSPCILAIATSILLGACPAPSKQASSDAGTTPSDAGTTPPPTEGAYEPFIADALAHILPTEGTTPRILYVAPPDGTTPGTGTREDPLRDLIAAVENAQAGDRLHLLPGTYRMNEIRDLWGHSTSVLRTRHSGTAGNPIILSTDPESLATAPENLAILDFQYGNQNGGARTTCFDMSHDFWIVENLEIQHIWGRGIFLQGFNNILRNNHLHHLNTTGTNNQGLIVVTASGRPTNNFIIRNHLHHVGEIDEMTDTLTSYGGINGGCVYTETRQSYDSTLPSLVGATSVEDIQQGVLPPDSHVYLYNNHVHHCYKGLSTKNDGEGPYFFIGNIIHDVNIGIKTAYSHSVIRDNIIHAGPDAEPGTGIQVGQQAGGDNYLSVQNGVDVTAEFNTVVGFTHGVWFYGGWSSRFRNNLVVGETEGVHVHRHEYFWFENGAYPGIRGEYLLGDLDASHPYRETHFASLPPVMYQLGYTRLQLTDNAYSREPVLASYGSRNDADLTGQVFDTDFVVLTAAQVEQLFRDADAGDYRFAAEAHPGYGSRLQ